MIAVIQQYTEQGLLSGLGDNRLCVTITLRMRACISQLFFL